jgi:hypothetical protein
MKKPKPTQAEMVQVATPVESEPREEMRAELRQFIAAFALEHNTPLNETVIHAFHQLFLYVKELDVKLNFKFVLDAETKKPAEKNKS